MLPDDLPPAGPTRNPSDSATPVAAVTPGPTPAQRMAIALGTAPPGAAAGGAPPDPAEA